jgi:hypothetical protein
MLLLETSERGKYSGKPLLVLRGATSVGQYDIPLIGLPRGDELPNIIIINLSVCQAGRIPAHHHDGFVEARGLAQVSVIDRQIDKFH